MARSRLAASLLFVLAACGGDGGMNAAERDDGGAAAPDAGAADGGAGDPSGDDAGAIPDAGAGFSQLGVCGLRSEGTVTRDSFASFEEVYLLGDEGFGEELCVVRFDVARVGEAPPGCDEAAGRQDECLWTHLVEYANPTVLKDEGGRCESSELMLDAAAIDAIDGHQVAYGYVFEYQGHNNVLMTYNEARAAWEAGVNAGWSEDSGAFQFDRRDGFCRY